MHLRCRLTKNSPRRAKSTPAGVFCTLLASASPIFKSVGCKGIPFVAAHKLILNVSKIRLRLICARASYLYRLFAKALEVGASTARRF